MKYVKSKIYFGKKKALSAFKKHLITLSYEIEIVLKKKKAKFYSVVSFSKTYLALQRYLWFKNILKDKYGIGISKKELDLFYKTFDEFKIVSLNLYKSGRINNKKIERFIKKNFLFYDEKEKMLDDIYIKREQAREAIKMFNALFASKYKNIPEKDEKTLQSLYDFYLEKLNSFNSNQKVVDIFNCVKEYVNVLQLTSKKGIEFVLEIEKRDVDIINDNYFSKFLSISKKFLPDYMNFIKRYYDKHIEITPNIPFDYIFYSRLVKDKKSKEILIEKNCLNFNIKEIVSESCAILDYYKNETIQSILKAYIEGRIFLGKGEESKCSYLFDSYITLQNIKLQSLVHEIGHYISYKQERKCAIYILGEKRTYVQEIFSIVNEFILLEKIKNLKISQKEKEKIYLDATFAIFSKIFECTTAFSLIVDIGKNTFEEISNNYLDMIKKMYKIEENHVMGIKYDWLFNQNILKSPSFIFYSICALKAFCIFQKILENDNRYKNKYYFIMKNSDRYSFKEILEELEVDNDIEITFEKCINYIKEIYN